MAYDGKTHVEYIAGLPYYFLWIGHAWNVYVYDKKMYKLAEAVLLLKDAKTIANNHANKKGQ